MSVHVVTCRPDQTAADAARLMSERDVGCVPVINARGSLVGIVTDRDLCLHAVKAGKRLDEIGLDTVMTRDVCTCLPSDDVDRVERCMSEAQVRRIPVVLGTRLVGIVSLGDVARARYGTWHSRLSQRLYADVARTLAAIVSPRARPARVAS
jgi:CBS domain-containing protein